MSSLSSVGCALGGAWRGGCVRWRELLRDVPGSECACGEWRGVAGAARRRVCHDIVMAGVAQAQGRGASGSNTRGITAAGAHTCAPHAAARQLHRQHLTKVLGQRSASGHHCGAGGRGRLCQCCRLSTAPSVDNGRIKWRAPLLSKGLAQQARRRCPPPHLTHNARGGQHWTLAVCACCIHTQQPPAPS